MKIQWNTISRNGKGWKSKKDYNGKHEYYGQFTYIIDAMTERDLLVKYNGNLDTLYECHDKCLVGKNNF